MTMGPRLRKLLLTVHVASSVGTLGAVAAFFVLAVAGFSVDALREAGVKRISVGSKLSTAAFGAVRRAAVEMLERGTFEYARDAMPFGDLQNLFAKHGIQA